VRRRAATDWGGRLPWANGEQKGQRCTGRYLETASKGQVTNAAQRFGRRIRGSRAARRLVGAVFGRLTRGRPLHVVELA
jgi:hypothetical protein